MTLLISQLLLGDVTLVLGLSLLVNYGEPTQPGRFLYYKEKDKISTIL